MTPPIRRRFHLAPAQWLQAVVLLSVFKARHGQTLLRADFSAGTEGWANQLLANTSAGVLAYVQVATPLRRECRRRSSNEWDKVVQCEIQGEDAGGRAFSEQNIATQQVTAARSAITIKPADPSAVPVEKETWYFVSPPGWSRDISQAYDGFLLVRIVHRVIPARARVPGDDVLLTARCGHHLSRSLPIDEGLAGRTHKLQLNAESGWIDSRTGRAPSRQSFLGVLAHLRDIKIRGGYYYGYEVTSLITAEVVKGEDAPFPCCSWRGEVTSCAQMPSSVLTAPGTRFPCEGEEHEVVRVRTVKPRFASRAGGARITVTGENFGLLGTRPIVRIAVIVLSSRCLVLSSRCFVISMETA